MIIVRAPRTMSGRIASVMRLRSSGGAFCDHSGFGTTPNIAPPSSPKNPSLTRDQLEIAERDSAAHRVEPALSAGGSADGWLLQLDEHAVRADGMNERHERAFGAGPRLLVDQPRAARLQLGERGARCPRPAA